MMVTDITSIRGSPIPSALTKLNITQTRNPIIRLVVKLLNHTAKSAVICKL